MNKFLMVVLCALTLLGAGCAGINVAKEKTLATPQKGLSAVYFYRESSFQGSLINWSVWENKQQPTQIGALKNGSYFYVYLSPGEHTFFANKNAESSSTITLKPGQNYYFQVRLDMGAISSRMKLAEVTENEGLRAIKDNDMSMVIAEGPKP
jgi:hypothetical protein